MSKRIDAVLVRVGEKREAVKKILTFNFDKARKTNAVTVIQLDAPVTTQVLELLFLSQPAVGVPSVYEVELYQSDPKGE